MEGMVRLCKMEGMVHLCNMEGMVHQSLLLLFLMATWLCNLSPPLLRGEQVGHKVDVLCYRDCTTRGRRSIGHSLVLSGVTLPPREGERKTVGWEKNEKGKLAPKLVNLSASMDPTKSANLYSPLLFLLFLLFPLAPRLLLSSLFVLPYPPNHQTHYPGTSTHAHLTTCTPHNMHTSQHAHLTTCTPQHAHLTTFTPHNMHTSQHAHLTTCTLLHMHTSQYAHLTTYTPHNMHTSTHAHLTTRTHLHMHTSQHAHIYTCTPHTSTHAHPHTSHTLHIPPQG